MSVSVCAKFGGNRTIAQSERGKLDSLPVPGDHFRFYDVTSGTTMASPMCQYRSVPSLVAIGQFPCPGEPNKSHFRFYEVTSGSVTSLPVPLWPSLGVSIGLCQVWWQSDNSPAWESQIRVTSCSWRSLPVLRRHFRYHYGVPYVSVSVCAKLSGNQIIPLPWRAK